MTNLPEKSHNSEIILYQTEDGKTKVQVRLMGETVWLSLNQMAELFQRDKSVISKHIRNIYLEGELQAEATVAKFATVHSEGSRQVSRTIDYYNLDVIISVGYRVKSHRGTQFRIWATQRLREYIIKGFTLDDERLKQAAGKAGMRLDGSENAHNRRKIQGYGFSMPEHRFSAGWAGLGQRCRKQWL
ncbi:MAG: RhuM family protein [Desulfobacterales bacterium]|nr:RhuM family protein [Desulfobacterales bacterium]